MKAENKKPTILEIVLYTECPIHGIRYPRGGKCPECKENERKKKSEKKK